MATHPSGYWRRNAAIGASIMVTITLIGMAVKVGGTIEHVQNRTVANEQQIERVDAEGTQQGRRTAIALVRMEGSMKEVNV